MKKSSVAENSATHVSKNSDMSYSHGNARIKYSAKSRSDLPQLCFDTPISRLSLSVILILITYTKHSNLLLKLFIHTSNFWQAVLFSK